MSAMIAIGGSDAARPLFSSTPDITTWTLVTGIRLTATTRRTDYYDYDGPIYTYGDLLPDQVIANVQRALQEAGYYAGPITGSLNPATRAAISNFQRDYGLIITGAIDEPTVQSLELN